MAEPADILPFGQKEPPLTDHIVNILGRYPDGGQILKELIQNADDAGAKEVKFLYDGRSFGTEYLTSEHLQKFQGPALYAYNDAMFKQEDWEGIQNLMRSNKKSDILKAGRFGIGFNSIYHTTDLPGIASGSFIGFLDPHKRCFEEGKSGQQYRISSGLLSGKIRHQFEPFQGVFDFDLNNESYKSTLFRFPLRICPSELSTTEYTKQKVNKLFESLHEEASIILLFMKSIQHISVYERDDDSATAKCLFKVEIAPGQCAMVKNEREMMLQKAVKEDLTKSSYVVDICLTSTSGETLFKWLVLNQIGVQKDERIAELSETLSLLPWVGCAVPINENALKEESGRIFCFLPLPRDVDCQTGLPILIHGAFGVMDNRRGLLWPGSECQNNETAEWNVLLVQKILCSVIYSALKSIIMDDPVTGLDEDDRCQLVYSTVPKLSSVIGHWNSLLGPLFQELKHLNLFHAQSSSGTSWITLKEGIVDQMKKARVLEETRKAVLETLLKHSQYKVITDLPDHVSQMVEKYFGERQDVTSTFFREFLKSNSIQIASHGDKLLLLDYILHDDPAPKELSGVSLLPLASGKFVTFGQHCHKTDPSASVFVSDGNCTEGLLPNMENRFLDKNIPAETYEKLVALASRLLDQINPTQMVTLTPDLVIQCLRFSLPNEWFDISEQKDIVSWNPDNADHPPEKWITDIWHWINDTFEESLKSFEGIPLIPLESNSEKKLGVLSKCSRFIFNSDSSKNMLPSQVVGLLEAAGCVVLPWSSAFLHARHPDINSYIASPVPAEVTLLLRRSSIKSAEKYILALSESERKVLRSFFASSHALSEDEKYVLLRLPLLVTLKETYTTALVEEQLLSVASPKFELPVGFNFRKGSQIISSAEPESFQLVRLFGLEPLQPADVLRRFLFPDIEIQSIYSREETTAIMLWILERMFEIQNPEFLNEMKSLSFVSTRSGESKRPCELYDPNDPVLSDLFIGEGNKFPSEEFSKTRVVSILQDLGLRTQGMITASDLLGVAEKVASSAVDYESAIKKVQALVTIFQKSPDVLQFELDGIPLISKLAELEWLPRAKKYPRGTGYPNFMHNQWYSSDVLFFKPGQLFRESHVLLVGSSAPILGIKMDGDIQDLLGIKKKVTVDEVIDHLKTAVDVWDEKKRSNSQYIEMLQEIYCYLSKFPSQEIVSEVIEQKELVNWVWHGTGFCSPKQIALEKDLPFDFRPPLFLLPDMFNDGGLLTKFFKTHGVRDSFSKDDIILVLAAIKDKHDDSSRKISAKCLEKDLKFCRSILEWLVSDGGVLHDRLREKVFVPVQVENKLVLEYCENCTYCDQEWLKHGKTELDIPDGIYLIHESIPIKLAILLGVPSLSYCLLSAECIEFEQTGPYEPITLRIKNILKEYKEGVGIFKELIQNADDAGATTVKFLVDWRRGRTDSLFSPGMAESQGPALWAYNDAVFTDKDFENINKLAGGTKVEDLSKIGRFGLGFNAVYHLTDVPSFISRSYLCVFDPNVNHIANHIRDKSRPGIRIDLAKNPRPLSAFADQFSLYNEVFGCKTDANNSETFSYQGTVFRFPFRTDCEAKKSEICQTVYNSSKVKEIVRTLQRSASLLLLYTQNVKHVELYELDSTNEPQDATLVLSINKEIQNTESSHSTACPSSYIEQCSDWWKQKLSLSYELEEEAPSRLEQVKIVEKENPSSITDTKAFLIKSCTWLVAYCVGKDVSIEFAAEEGQKDGLLPLAAAAALLHSNTNNNVMDTATFTAKRIDGEAFCFLPLSIPTRLPIHVNSSFAVRSNRDGIWEKTTAEENPESRWNEALLKDAIPEAYFKLLAGMVDLSQNSCLEKFDQCFHDFWPRLATSTTTWTVLGSSFYSKLVERRLKLFCSDGVWMDITEGFILDEELRQNHHDNVVKTLQKLGEYVFDLPADVIHSMNKSVNKSVTDITLSLVSFFKDFLFPNLSTIPAELRVPIVRYGLRYVLQESRPDWEQLASLYKEYECIPCSPDGQKLARPCELINPHDKNIAMLYSPEEHRFPFEELDDNELFALEKLGMVKDLLCWDEIRGRAKSIEELSFSDKEAALQRSRFLIKYLRLNIERMGDMSDRQLLCDIKFLPVRRTPPEYYTLPWKGAMFDATEFLSPNDLFLPKDVYLIGSSSLIVDNTDESGCGQLNANVAHVLGISERRPSCHEVLEQLEITKEFESAANTNMKQAVCNRVYKHLDEVLERERDSELVIEKLKNIPWLFLHEMFVESRKVALQWKGYAIPYLFRVLDEYQRDYRLLLELTGIKKVFKPSDFLEALDALRQTKQDSCLEQDEIKLVVTLTNELKNNVNEIKERIGTIPLPDSKGILYESQDLTIPESFAVKYLGTERYIHPDIAQSIALKLGAKQLRTRRREKYGNSMSISFGQFEKLTDRIKNILESYPRDEGILKELVQNADDAKATEIQFIYDKRTLPHERVLQNKADEIQGPALCVYNNKHFNEEDFNGICKLGIGSKRDDPEKTGQYGIGFNAVYHLTDCPSFLSNDDTLCILDPHCEYSPEATSEAPGGRYNNIDKDFKDIFSDSLCGYLGEFGDYFPLGGSTMFRFPLRTHKQTQTSEISEIPVTDVIIANLLSKFKLEAKKLLLFLNHVQKICLWEIDDKSKLRQLYSVNSKLKQNDKKKLHDLHRHLHENKKVATGDVPMKDMAYTIRIQEYTIRIQDDTTKLKDKWLIHQCCGIETVTDKQTPNVSDLGLFPRGGIAARLSADDTTKLKEKWLIHQCCGIETVTDKQTPNVSDLGLFPRGGIAARLSADRHVSEEYVAYCFLPLPVLTPLPVHVNGHFALDGSRRDLWYDPNETCRKTKWNDFMKARVLAPAYASLINKARKYIPRCEKDSHMIYFSSEEDAMKGLDWYHKLFPDPAKDPKWEMLAVAVYQCLKETPILPVVYQSDNVVATEKNKRGTSGSSKSPNAMVLNKSPNTMVLNKSPNAMVLRKRKRTTSGNGSFRNASGKFSPHKINHTESARETSSEHTKTARSAAIDQRRDQLIKEELIKEEIIPTRLCVREWLPPNCVYFTKTGERETKKSLFATLLRIHMSLLLYSPWRIHVAFIQAEVKSHFLDPKNVIQFLLTSQDESSKCNIGKLPVQLSISNIQDISSLRSILEYCKEELVKIPESLEGLPLLLTADGMLRMFTSENPVYCSLFSDLFPGKAFKFVWNEEEPNKENLVLLLSTFCDIQPHCVIRNLTVQSLANDFMSDVFSGKLPLGKRKHVAWNYPESGILSKKWFSRLWMFLKTTLGLKERSNTEILLDSLGQYPIVPTKDGNLATVNNAKSVLAVTRRKAGSSLQQQVTGILESLACPFLDEDITECALSVVCPLVANPHCVSDVLHVLDYMKSTETLDMAKFNEKEINSLLRFFQEDCETEESMCIAKTLPLYKGVDGDYHSLSTYRSCIRVPAGLPNGGIKELQSIHETRILFLPPVASDLNRLYKALGIVVDCRISQFYIDYVLPSFSSFSRECQIEFLTKIRQSSNVKTDDLMSYLRSTRCIPDQTGKLRLASSYFNPHNDLFKVMFKPDSNVFPASPFNKIDWIKFLIQIGLKESCDEQKFIEFAKDVEESALRMTGDGDGISAQSEALVKYLLQSGNTWSFDVISKIKFIFPTEVEEELSSLHSQYHVDGKLEYVSYNDSVPWKDRNLVWTSAKLLPKWAYPGNHYLVSSLGIPLKPPIEAVTEHMKIISTCASERMTVPDSTLPKRLIDVFVDIYVFLQGLMNCAEEPLSTNCNEECRTIGSYLSPIACILLNKERYLVRGEDLSFQDTKEKLKPHFYMVPREYSVYEHLLKRLGVTEKVNASQMANVLNSMKDSCTNETMSKEEDEKARYATEMLFQSLLADKENELESSLSNCEVLNLPSMTKRLVKSNVLVCRLLPRLRESVAKLGYEILCPLEKCGLKRELENKYLDALPERLRPRPLANLVREELDPFCKKRMRCSYCKDMNCSFIDNFILVLRSSQFERGILRLLKHQKKLAALEEEDRARAARFSSTKLTVIKCMREVKIHLVDVATGKPLPQSTMERICHVEREDNSWTLYIQHDFGGKKTNAILAKAVNEIMDGCLEQIGELSDMLSCDSPSQIPGVLNDHDVTPDDHEDSEELGQSVPVVYHYLMIQNPLCHFEEGTRVAYGRDRVNGRDWSETDQEEESTSYTLVKILGRANATDTDAAEYDFNAQYKIDLGSKAEYKTVSVLDIYSYHQDDMGNLVLEDEDTASVVNVVVEKLHITRVLKLAKKLKLILQRRKVLRRLFLHWIRCTDSEVAAELTAFIQSEVTRLEVLREEEIRFFTSYWRRRWRREVTTFSSYRHWMSFDSGDYYGSRMYRFCDAQDYVNPDLAEAQRWIKQSEADLNVAKILRNKSHSQVCHMSQQCVEKGLKGALYAKCGIPQRELRTHDVHHLASSVRRLPGAPSEVDRAGKVASYYLSTRYPDNQPKYRVPAEQFNEEEAKDALEVAETVFTALKQFVDDNDD